MPAHGKLVMRQANVNKIYIFTIIVTKSMNKIFKYSLIFASAVIALACSHSKVQTGKVTFVGKFSDSFPVEKNYTVKISVPELVDGSKQIDEYETTVMMDRSFSLSIPLFRSVYGMLSINDEELGAFFLSPEKETKIDLSLTGDNKIQVKVIKGQALTLDDIGRIGESFIKFVGKVLDPKSLADLQWNMSSEEYKKYILQWTDKQIITVVDENKDLSEDLKQLLYKELKWWTFNQYLFDYENTIRGLYESERNETAIKDTIFTPVKPNKAYYSFLSYFDWNDSPVFNTPPSYPRIFQAILTDSILNIPNIENKSLNDWLNEVRTIISPLIGSGNDLFYDMLLLHAYVNQLNNDAKPLSKEQIEEINTYFKNPTFARYIFANNEALIKQTYFPVYVKETPIVINKEKLMETILSSYRGKAVVVDFWATWCGPCMEAMQKMKTIKEEFLDKDVVFVYITGVSSHKDLWEKTIQNISGEHYYLDKEEWESISHSKQYDIDVIPTYLFFDSNGVLNNKISGYPGNEEMKKMVEELLP